MGETGENVAERFGVTREDQDEFALASQQRWAAAHEAGRFDDEIVAVGDVARDEHPRSDTSLEKLAALKLVEHARLARAHERRRIAQPGERGSAATAGRQVGLD
jgi:acetyl-CoA acetyltransferase